MEGLLDEIDSAAVRTYLNVLGWHPERNDAQRSIWRHASGARVFVPGRRGPDSADLLRMALHEIASAEKRDEEEVEIDLAWRKFDRLEVRRAVPASAVSLSEAVSMHEALHDLIASGATAATDRRRCFRGRSPALVDEYVDGVQMIPTAISSFALRALLPVNQPTFQVQLPLMGLASPDVRRMTTMVMSAASHAVKVATEVGSGAPMARWSDAVVNGVSSNLCDALAQLPGSQGSRDAGDATVELEWSWAERGDPLPDVKVPVELGSVLAAGAAVLRGDPEEHHIRQIGLITRLHRESATGPGAVTVRGHLEGRGLGTRSLTFRLDEASYRRAMAAHDAGVSVRITALAQRTPRRVRIVRVDDLEVLS